MAGSPPVTESDPQMVLDAIRNFLKREFAGGFVLFAAAVLAVVVSNTPLDRFYDWFLNIPVEIRIGALHIAKPMLLWINDGLMAVFFFLIGLEIKREFLEGKLSSVSQVALPAAAAIGGMIVPAGIYAALNIGDPENLNGWAIPAATDIAFALGILSLLGNRVPLSLKVLLTAIAIFDDLGAIILIAVFYTDQMSLLSLTFALAAFAVLVVLNQRNVVRAGPYIVVGIIMWVCVLKSGVHATLAGVTVAMAIPLRATDTYGRSPLRHLEHELHRWIAFGILPLFAFANAGVTFDGIGLHSFVEPVKLGISTGLFFGKQLGIFGALWLMIAFGFSRMPDDTNWVQLYGVSLLCGIGFTMSLFIGGLAWEHSDFDAPVRLGVITGSIFSALLGFLILSLGAIKRPQSGELSGV
jgi:NhaA family Na+:H+ antiporter